MRNDYKDFYVGSRAQSRSRKRKSNMILNTLIGIIVLLIIIVGANIFFGEENNEAGQTATSEQNNNENNGSLGSDSDDNEEEEQQGEDVDPNTDSEEPVEEEDETSTDATDDTETETDTDTDVDTSDGEVIVEESDDPNVEQTIINASWQPIGTEQEGPHTKNFSDESQDWKEMQQAIATALGTTKEGLTYWCVENGGGNQVIGTVTQKGNSADPYRVFIEWVDGQGWKPIKVQKLIENDKQNSC